MNPHPNPDDMSLRRDPLHRVRRRLLRGLLVAAVAVTVAGTALAVFVATGSGAGSAKVGALGAPTSVVATAANSSTSSGPSPVTITWNAPGAGATPSGYKVVRDDGSTQVTLSCSASPCTDTTVPSGTYTYHVTSLLRTSWTSAAANSNSLTVANDSTPPTTALSLTSPSHAALSGSGPYTLYYKGNTSGSFRIADAVTDSGGGPASATFPGVSATGWSGHTTSELVTSGTGSPPTITYTSSGTQLYQWSANPSNPGAATVTARDVAGNPTNDTVSFVSDITAPTVTITAPLGTSATQPVTYAGTAGNQSADATHSADSTTVTVFVCSGTVSACNAGTSPVQILTATESGGNWSVVAPSLVSGTYTAQAQQSDAVGNTGTSSVDTFATVASLSSTGAGSYTLTVAPHISSVGFTFKGAGGGGGGNTGHDGAAGGLVSGTITIPDSASPTQFTVIVGGGGGGGSNNNGGTSGPGCAAGGAGGGGSASANGGGGGGGATCIYVKGSPAGTIVAVGGGGGGAGGSGTGGSGGVGGGGPSTNPGSNCGSTCNGSTGGGTQTGGGGGTTSTSGTSFPFAISTNSGGSAGSGGTAGTGGTCSAGVCSAGGVGGDGGHGGNGGGGGGGGYASGGGGGGGSSNPGGGGGGGSAYTGGAQVSGNNYTVSVTTATNGGGAAGGAGSSGSGGGSAGATGSFSFTGAGLSDPPDDPPAPPPPTTTDTTTTGTTTTDTTTTTTDTTTTDTTTTDTTTTDTTTTDTTPTDTTTTDPTTTTTCTADTTTTDTTTTDTTPTDTTGTSTTPQDTTCTGSVSPGQLSQGLSTGRAVLFFAVMGGSLLGMGAALTMPIPRRRRTRSRRKS